MLSLTPLGAPGESPPADVESQKQQQQQRRDGGTASAGAAAEEAASAAAALSSSSSADQHQQSAPQQLHQQQQQARPASGAGGPQGAAAMWHSARSVLAIRSFQIIVMQGIVGSMPWQAMVRVQRVVCGWCEGEGEGAVRGRSA